LHKTTITFVYIYMYIFLSLSLSLCVCRLQEEAEKQRRHDEEAARLKEEWKLARRLKNNAAGTDMKEGNNPEYLS